DLHLVGVVREVLPPVLTAGQQHLGVGRTPDDRAVGGGDDRGDPGAVEPGGARSGEPQMEGDLGGAGRGGEGEGDLLPVVGAGGRVLLVIGADQLPARVEEERVDVGALAGGAVGLDPGAVLVDLAGDHRDPRLVVGGDEPAAVGDR